MSWQDWLYQCLPISLKWFLLHFSECCKTTVLWIGPLWGHKGHWWLFSDHFHPLLATFLCSKKSSVFAGGSFSFFLERVFFFSPHNKMIDAVLHRYDKTSWEIVQYGTFRCLSCEVLHMQQVLEFKVAALWVANMLPPTLTTYLQQCDWLPSWTCSNVFPQ